jgi:excisionase family DNA binding protein
VLPLVIAHPLSFPLGHTNLGRFCSWAPKLGVTLIVLHSCRQISYYTILRVMAACNDKPDPSPTAAVLTVEEAAALLRISRGSAYEAVRCGQIPVLRLGRRILVPRAKLMALLGEGELALGREVE